MSSVIMRDPVVAADGLSYERRFIEKWLRDGNRSSPVTREPLRFPHLYPNQHLRTLIQRRPHGGSSIAALHIADPHFKQMDPNERRTAEVERRKRARHKYMAPTTRTHPAPPLDAPLSPLIV